MAQPSRERIPIDSPSNRLVRMMRDLRDPAGRREHEAFLIEGTRLVGEAVEAGWPVRAAIYDVSRANTDPKLAELVAKIPGSQPATDRAIKHAADTVTPQGIVAAAALPAADVRIEASEQLVLVLDGLRDPGNMGTLLRSAAGAGVRVVLVTRGSTDPFSPKVVRGAMGAHFRLRIAADLAWAEIVRIVGSKLDIVLAESDAGTPYFERDWRKPAAIVIGSEAHGPSEDAIKAASSAVSIPLHGGVESLNAAIAGSVIMFEAKRQRERKRETGTED